MSRELDVYSRIGQFSPCGDEGRDIWASDWTPDMKVVFDAVVIKRTNWTFLAAVSFCLFFVPEISLSVGSRVFVSVLNCAGTLTFLHSHRYSASSVQ